MNITIDDGSALSNASSEDVFEDNYEDVSYTTDKVSTAGSDPALESSSHDEEVGRSETAAVFKLRLLVMLVLFLAAVAVSIVVYLITHNGEKDEFQSQFDGSAAKILESFEAVAARKMGAISALEVAMIAHGIDHSSNWPFVTLSSFQERAANARAESGALFVKVCPYVREDQLAKWENYTSFDENQWIQEGIAYQIEKAKVNALDLDLFHLPRQFSDVNTGFVHNLDSNSMRVKEDGPGPYMPVWQTSPIIKDKEVNINIFKKKEVAEAAKTCFNTGSAVIGTAMLAPPGGLEHSNHDTELFAALLSLQAKKPVKYSGDPMSRVFLPIYNSFELERYAVGVMAATIHWASYFSHILPPNIKGLTAVLENPCDGAFTYVINGSQVIYQGTGDQHDHNYEYMKRTSSLEPIKYISDGTEFGLPIFQGKCPWTLSVFPSQTFYDDYNSSTPAIITVAVFFVFLFTAVMFFVYDRLVERRQRLILRRAVQSSAIVSDLFPKAVRDRLMENTEQPKSNTHKGTYMNQNNRLKSFLGGSEDSEVDLQPIADLFPHTTVLFADIAGFTAWSSSRDPAHVFILLQTVYQAFDVLAKRRKVFKVETIGDSYVAVTGVPESQAQHAVIMAKFAADCNVKMVEIARRLEKELGPGTGDLSMRFGMHSGPVTAGVLRGERSRFQLFGDTVNTAARMESTGAKLMIQASKATADCLITAGKPHWVTLREDMVDAKGKGVLQTYWIMPTARKGDSSTSSRHTETRDTTHEAPRFGGTPLTLVDTSRHDRLIDWMVELLKGYIKPILAKRYVTSKNLPTEASFAAASIRFSGTSFLDEVSEIVSLPKFDPKASVTAKSLTDVEVSEECSSQLRQFVSIIASTYHANDFHNFEHAAHVTMSAHKFLLRIATPDLKEDTSRDSSSKQNAMASQIHDYTHGVTSDPLTLFAIVFSALIHDVDHRGISNTQLIKEEGCMADVYKNKSVAEQNSLSLAWELLMSKGFEELRSNLFASEEELLRFRRVVINVVLATDIFDKELNDLRKDRWDKAFAGQDQQQVYSLFSSKRNNNLRATIVLEHIIQASDVSHTMQHWHIYRKWNERLFREMTRAFLAGRMAADPATFWYEGELSFFDNYVIPLAKKLKDCNVFGVSSDECLNYAIRNREEWKERGQQMIEEMVQDITDEEKTHG